MFRRLNIASPLESSAKPLFSVHQEGAMKILGLLFILVGMFLCCTILFWFAGLPAVGVGALLYIAGRNTPSGPVSKVCQAIIAVPIAVCVVWAGLLFAGVLRDTASRMNATPAGQHSTAAAQHSSQPAQHAKYHPVTH
jgi:hypothetical protein